MFTFFKKVNISTIRCSNKRISVFFLVVYSIWQHVYLVTFPSNMY